MKDTAPISQGIIAVAALFGVVGGGVAYVMGGFELIGAVFIGCLVAALVAILLWLGWRKPAPRYEGAPAMKIPDIAGESQTAAPAAAAPVAAAAAAPVAEAAPAAPAAKAEPKPAPKKKPAAKTAKPKVEATPDYDGDGVLEGKDEGQRPAALDGPRDGKADNLKEIKGIGPKLEKLCNSLGFYHFDQIAAWSADEVAWVDANLEGFKGRVTRDTWVEQAKILAAGGETEFSKKVDKGGVY